MALRVPTALLLLLAATASAQSAPFVPRDLREVVRIPLGQRVDRSCQPCADGFCAKLFLGRRLSPTLASLPRRRGVYWLLRRERVDGTWLRIDTPAGAVRCQVVNTPTGSMLYIGTVHRRRVLVALKQRVKQPSSASALTKEIEKLLRARRYADAAVLLQRLDSKPALSDYVRLRLADLHFLRGRLPTAHARYAAVARAAGWKQAGLEAALRAATLAFAIDGRSPSKALINAVAGQAGVRGTETRRFLANLLAESGALDAALRLLYRDHDAATQSLTRRLASSAIRRCRAAKKPYCAAIAFYRAEPALKGPKASALLCESALAFLELGLPAEAQRLLQQVLRQSPERWLQERALAELVRAYADGGDAFRALGTAAYYLSLYQRAPGARVVRNLRARVLLDRGRVRHLAEKEQELPLLLAARVQRALAVSRGEADGPLWRRLRRLRREQEALKRQLAAIRVAGRKR